MAVKNKCANEGMGLFHRMQATLATPQPHSAALSLRPICFHFKCRGLSVYLLL